MAENFKISSTGLLIQNNRAFLPSTNINIFPCSRRGQAGIEEAGSASYYDPEARLNTEHTNRLHTAVNGFTDSFIINNQFNDGGTLAFVLKGYRVEVKEFSPSSIAAALGVTDNDILYAHLSLHNDISLNVTGYYTKILYRQSTAANDKNYLDVSYSYTEESTTRKGDFFVGVSFTADKAAKDAGVTPYVLPLFSKVNGTWQLVQTSLLPKVEHDETENSIKISGDFTVEHTKDNGTQQVSFKVTEDETVLGPTIMSKLAVATSDSVKLDDISNGSITAEADILAKNAITAENNLSVPEVFLANNPDKKVTISAENGLEVTKNTLIKGELTVESDTNLQTLAAGATTLSSTLDVTGKVTAKNGLDVKGGVAVTTGSLTVKENITAETGNLTVSRGNANIHGKTTTNELQVSTYAKIKDLDVDTNIDTNTLTANTSISTPVANVTDTLNVQSGRDAEPAIANIDNAIITNLAVGAQATIKDETVETSTIERSITVHNTTNAAKAAIDILEADKATLGDLAVQAGLNGSTGSITAKEVKADILTQNGNQVPKITIEQVSDKGVEPEIWQLQVSHVITKPKS